MVGDDGRVKVLVCGRVKPGTGLAAAPFFENNRLALGKFGRTSFRTHGSRLGSVVKMRVQEREQHLNRRSCSGGVVQEIERVWCIVMVYERNRQLVGRRIREKPVDRVIQAGHLILACSRDEHRNVLREVVDALSRTRIFKLPLCRSVGDDRFAGTVQHVSVAKTGALQKVVLLLHEKR